MFTEKRITYKLEPAILIGQKAGLFLATLARSKGEEKEGKEEFGQAREFYLETETNCSRIAMRLFGKGKKEAAQRADAPKDSVLQLRATVDMLEKKERHLDSKIAAEVALAKSLVSTNRQAALTAMKRKHMYESQREHTRGARFNLETQLMTIENATINMETLQAMKAGSATMKQMHGQLDVDGVDRTMDDIREQMDLASEINNAISQPLGMEGLGGMGLDEDELEAELEQLEQSEMDRMLLNVGQPAPSVASTGAVGVPSMPEVPIGSKSPAISVADEDAELAELRQSMAL